MSDPPNVSTESTQKRSGAVDYNRLNGSGCDPSSTQVSCVFCPTKLGGWKQFLAHLLKEPGIQLFACHFCSTAFPTRQALQNHSCSVNPDGFEPGNVFVDKICYQYIFCSSCGISIGLWHPDSEENYRALLRTHSVTNLRSLAVYAEKRLVVGSEGQDIRIPFLPSIGSIPTICTTCEIPFIQVFDIEAHAKEHSDNKVKACPCCLATVASKTFSAVHKLFHVKTPSRLTDFSDSFPQNEQYASGSAGKVLHKDQLVFCDLCGKYTPAQTFNKTHDCATDFTRRYMVAGTLVKCPAVSLEPVKFDIEDKGTQQLLLESVAEEFETNAFLSLEKNVAIRAPAPEGFKPNQWVCSECSLLFPSDVLARFHYDRKHRHVDSATKNFVAPLHNPARGKFDLKCSICADEFLCSLDALKRHFLLAHDKWLKNYDAVAEAAGVAHVDKAFSSEMPKNAEESPNKTKISETTKTSWNCPACATENSTLDDLKTHLKSRHIHICTGCAHCFLSEDFKRVHQQLCKSSLHINAKFFCHICRESFPTLPRYYVHLINDHHKDVNFNDKTGQVFPICSAIVSNGTNPTTPTSVAKEMSNNTAPPKPPAMNVVASPIMARSSPQRIAPKTMVIKAKESVEGMKNESTEVRLFPAPIPPRPEQKPSIPIHPSLTPYSYFCPVCEADPFPYKHNLISHVTTNHVCGTRCELCGMGFNTKLIAAHHVVYSCSRVDPTKCKVCFMKFNLDSELSEHMKKEHQAAYYKCNICDQQFAWKGKFRQHMDDHAMKIRGPISGPTSIGDHCLQCNLKFNTVRKFKLHMEYAHNQVYSSRPETPESPPRKKPRSIVVMGRNATQGRAIVKIVSESSQLKSSPDSHLRPKPHQLQLQFTPKPHPTLTQPKTQDTADDLLVVESLPQLKRKPENLDSSNPKSNDEELMILSSDEEDDEKKSTTVSTNNRTQIYPCTLCSEKFHTKVGLKDHMKSHEFDVGGTIQDTLPVPLNDTVFLCRLCSLVYQSESVFKRHMSKHGSHSSCLQCSSVCFTEVQLKAHLQAHQGGKLIYGCVECHSAYRTELELSRHIQSKHGRPLLWFCKSCGLASTNRQVVLTHVTLEGTCFPPTRENPNSRIGVAPHQKLHFQPERPDEYKEGLKRSGIPFSVGECVHRSFLAYNEALLCCPLCGTLVPASKFMLENASLRKSGQLKLELETASGKANILLTTKTDEPGPTRSRTEGSSSENSPPPNLQPSRQNEARPETSKNVNKDISSQLNHEDETDVEEPSCSGKPDSIVTDEPSQSAAPSPKNDEFVDGKWVCGVCREKVSSKAALKVHHLKHNPGHSNFCLECGTPFEEQSDLESHLMTAHFKQKIKFQLSCRNCRTIFDSVERFKAHFTESIQCFGTYRSPECKMLFQTERLRDIHSGNHLEGKKKCCPLCGACFATEGEERSHRLMAHAFNKWFMCRECGLCFGEEPQLQTHFRCKHLIIKFDKSRQKTTLCTLCKTQLQENQLDSHLLELHEVVGYKGRTPVILTDEYRKFTT